MARVPLPPLPRAGASFLGVGMASCYDRFLVLVGLRFRVRLGAELAVDLVERDRLVHPDVTWSLVRCPS